MWALVESDTIQEIFNDPKALSIGDVQYPKNIFSLWSAEELQAIGIYPVEINSSNYKNVNYYNNAEISYSFDSENNKVVGSYGTATAKALDDTLWTSDDDPLPAGTSVGDIKDVGLKNQHKEDGAKIIGIYSSLVYLYSNQKEDKEFVKFMEDKYQYFTDTKIKKAMIYDLWAGSFFNPGPYNWSYPFLQFVDTSLLEKIMFNVFKEGISFLLVYAAVLMVDNKDIYLKANDILEEQEYDPNVIRSVIMSTGAKLSERNTQLTTQDSPRPPENQAN